MVQKTEYYLGSLEFVELNGTQEELDQINSGYKYTVKMYDAHGSYTFKGNDNDIMQQIPSSSSGSGGSSKK